MFSYADWAAEIFMANTLAYRQRDRVMASGR